MGATQFPNEIAIVLLTSILVLELASIVGLSQSATSGLLYSIDKILGMMTFIVSLLGIYGLLKRKKVGSYLALLASTFWVVLGCFAFFRTYGTSQLNMALLTQTGATFALGTLTLVCVFKSSFDQHNGVNSMLHASNSFDRKGSSHALDKHAVETIDVAKKYFLGQNVVSAINGVSMKVHRGEFVAIMGPSGSGKSTLLNLIGALDKPSSGQVLIDGINISTLDEEGLAKLRNKKIGFVFQAYNLIARSTVLRNMELPALVRGYPTEERLQRVTRLLAIVGLEDKSPRKPQTLSGGEQQRVAIARALINDPEIVLADEPTGNVDSKTGRVIVDFLRKLNAKRGTTVIVVTHDPEVASKADRIIQLRDGKIIQKN